MSLIYTKEPAKFQPVLSDDLFFTVSADTTNTFKFRYSYVLYADDQPVFSGKCTPNPYGLGIIDVQQILETYTTSLPVSVWNTTNIYTHQTFPFSRPYNEEVISYQLRTGYEYASTALGAVSGFTGVGDTIGEPSVQSTLLKTFRSTMGTNGRANQQAFNIDPFVLSGTPVGTNPTTSGLYLTNSPRIRNIDPSEYYTLAFTNYYMEFSSGGTLSEPYYVQYTFYDDQGLVITATTYDNITTNGGGPRTNCNQVYQELYLLDPASGTTDYNTMYVGAGPANLPSLPAGTSYYHVQLFGKFTGTTSPIVPTPTPTPSSRPACVCAGYELTSVVGQTTATYLNCAEDQYILVTVQQGEIATFCACEFTVEILSGTDYILTNTGSCVAVTPTPTPTAPCVGCTRYSVEYTGSSESVATVSYINCTNGQSQTFFAESGVIYTICACQLPFDSGEVVYTDEGPCTVDPTPTPTPTRTGTPTPTPSLATYTYLGRSTPDAADGPTACSTYTTVRSYTGLKTLSTLTVGDFLYDSYPSSPTNGGGQWVALKVGGAGAAYSFQIDTNGEILDTYTC